MVNNNFNRVVLPILIALIYSVSSFGQGCDPQITQLTILHPLPCLGETNTTDIELRWAMAGGNPTCTAPEGSWQIQVNLPASSSYVVNSAADVTVPSDFTWTLGGDGHTLTGTNNIDIPWFSEGTILIHVTGDTGNLCSPVATNTNIQIIPSVVGGSPGSFSNNTGNDVQSDAIGVDALLPVEFSNVNARNQDCNTVDVAWQTQSEINNDGFFVERSIGSTDDFKSLGFVEGRRNSNTEQSYTFEDDINGFKGNDNIYYRIKQVDVDGRFDYSETVTIKLECDDTAVGISVYPNPTINDLYVSIDGNLEVASSIEILNNLNQKVASQPVDQTAFRTKIDMTKYVAGMYYIRVLDRNNEIIFTKKVILTK